MHRLSSLPESPPTLSDEAAEQSPLPRKARNGRSRSWKAGLQWTRWLHVYTSMIALLLVLFFGLTGITLNHPDWTLGFDPATETSAGVLPGGWVGSDGAVEFLVVSEFVRNEYGVKGEVTDFGTEATDGFISYRGPGYAADVFFDLATGDYSLTVEQQGWIGVMNDLHKGRDTNSSWNWLIDVSGGFLVLIALTGLGLQLFLQKRRRAALLVALGGIVVTAVLTIVALT